MKKTGYVVSRSFKVTESGTIRKGICSLLLVVNSNFGSISHSFGATATYWTKDTSVLFNSLAGGHPLRIC